MAAVFAAVKITRRQVPLSTTKTIQDNPTTWATSRRSGVKMRAVALPLLSYRLFSLDESVQELASLKDVPGGEGGLIHEASAR